MKSLLLFLTIVCTLLSSTKAQNCDDVVDSPCETGGTNVDPKCTAHLVGDFMQANAGGFSGDSICEFLTLATTPGQGGSIWIDTYCDDQVFFDFNDALRISEGFSSCVDIHTYCCNPITLAPTDVPTYSPTLSPTDAPTTLMPTSAPSGSPIEAPTLSPTNAPTTSSPTTPPTAFFESETNVIAVAGGGGGGLLLLALLALLVLRRRGSSDSEDEPKAIKAERQGGNAMTPPTSIFDWEKHIDKKTGEVYFFNPKTGESRWDPPEINSPSASASA